MILYENTIEHFRKALDNRTLIRYIISEYESAMNMKIDPLLKARWKYMIIMLGDVILFDKDINNDCGIRLDFHDSSNRQEVTVIMASETGNVTGVLLINLVPWEKVRLCDEDDMVYYDSGAGEGEQKTVHPSFQLAATRKFITAGIHDDSINVRSMALLYDCEYTKENDIVTRYNQELIKRFPTYYINQVEEFSRYVQEVTSGGNGKEALRRLKLLGNSGANDTDLLYPEQKTIVSTVRKHLENNEVAWFIIKNPSGTGGSTMLDAIRKEADGNGREILLIDKEEIADTEQFTTDRVVVWLYDDYEDEVRIQKAKEIAQDKNIVVHNMKLDETPGLADDGKGLNWIRRYLHMKTDKKLEWDPAQYPIEIVDTPEELPDREGYASVIIRNNIYRDPGTGGIIGSEQAFKAVYRQMSKGKRGVYVYPEDPVLRDYLKKGVQDAKNKYSWLRDFISDYEMDAEQLQEAQAGTLKNDTVHDKFAKQAIRYMGQSAWDKLEEQSRNWIVSGLLAYHDMKKYDQLLDFSGVCISICKAVEAETRKRYFSCYREYLTEKYGIEAAEKAPYVMIRDSRNSFEKEFVEDSRFMLGTIPEVTGIGKNGKGDNRYVWNEFDAYCMDELLIEPEDAYYTISEHIEYTEKIRRDYRNQAAHGQSIDVIQAKDCIDYVVGIMHRLGIMLDAYRF